MIFVLLKNSILILNSKSYGLKPKFITNTNFKELNHV